MLRRTLLPLLGLVLLAARPGATWSIVCVNTKTREVGVATATCLTNFDIRKGVPILYVGEGAAAAQSFLDVTGRNRRIIFESFRDTEETPAEILAELASRDSGHQTRQYGIANFTGAPVTFTGTGAGHARGGVAGAEGEFLYAVQGNVLVGIEVVLAAEQAFRDEPGDMGQRLVAAMEAARWLGGDGRCSCAVMTPTACGVPPPDFAKSAHCGTILVARVGDTNGPCDATNGCAQGSYYMTLNVRGNQFDPDPVDVLHERFKTWRKRLEGRPDGIYSTAGPRKGLPADSVTEREVTVELFDVDKQPIRHGGATIEVSAGDLGSIAQPGPVTDLGDGRYRFTLRAGDSAGLDRFEIRVTDVNPNDATDVVTATLYPLLEVENVDAALFSADEALPGVDGGSVSFVVNRRDAPNAPYLIVARLATAGRLRAGALASRLVLPLADRPFFPAGPLALDERGRAEAVLNVPPGVLAPLVGGRVEFTAYVLGQGSSEATNSVVLPVGR